MHKPANIALSSWLSVVRSNLSPQSIRLSQIPASSITHATSSTSRVFRASYAMPPKQITLGNYLRDPNAMKPQQSRLAFSLQANDKGQVEQRGVTRLKTESTSRLSQRDEAETQHTPTKATLKRSASLDTSDSDDELPFKRRRELIQTGTRFKSPNGNPVPPARKVKVEPDASGAITSDNSLACTSFGTEIVAAMPHTFNEDGQPEISPAVDSENLHASNASQHTSLKNVDEGHGDENNSTASISTSADEVDLEDVKEVESEPEDNLDSENEDPEIEKKAREKMQTTLGSKTNNLYPDWKLGAAVPYAALCTTFSKIEMTSKRLEISAHCSLFLRQVLRLTPADLLPTIQLMVNKIAADYTGIELGIGESLIMKAIGETTGRSLQIIKADHKEIGDLGLVAAKSRLNQPTMFKPKPLTVRGVHEGLMAIATFEGQGAQSRKIGGIKKLLAAADAHLAGNGSKGIDITKDRGGPSEAKFIIRALEGKMRLGLAEKTALVALAHAMVFHETAKKGTGNPTTEELAKGEQMLKAVFNELPSYEVVVPAMIEYGILNLRDHCSLRPGVPLKPMLAKPTKSITEVLDRFDGRDFSCEYKYDGERAQIHFVAYDAPLEYATAIPSAGKSVKGISNIFSRNSEDLSKKYPDILEKLPSWVNSGTTSFVLDCETVAWDLERRTVLPFQQLMTRKRKDVKAEDVKVKVCVFAFDLLFLNGEALVNKPFRERRDLLHSAFVEMESEFAFAKYGNTSELDTIQTLLEESVKASCEGLMVKMLDGPEAFYEPSRRSQNWLKVKKDYLSGVGDSLDLVVLGAYFGKGKRTSVYGAFLLACYNQNNQQFETVCNIGTGFSEALLEDFYNQLESISISRPKPFYSHSSGNKDQPDVWFEPRVVWEVKTADLTLSPRYRAAAAEMDGDKGISLRFPRFLKVRDDKKPEEATTSRAVAEMYRAQEGVGKSKGPSVDDDFEY